MSIYREATMINPTKVLSNVAIQANQAGIGRGVVNEVMSPIVGMGSQAPALADKMIQNIPEMKTQLGLLDGIKTGAEPLHLNPMPSQITGEQTIAHEQKQTAKTMPLKPMPSHISEGRGPIGLNRLSESLTNMHQALAHTNEPSAQQAVHHFQKAGALLEGLQGMGQQIQPGDLAVTKSQIQRAIQQVARFVTENPDKVLDLLEKPEKLGEHFGSRLGTDNLESMLRTTAELDYRGMLGGHLGDGANYAIGGKLHMGADKMGASVVHSEHSDSHVAYGECDHIEGTWRPGLDEQAQDSPTATQAVIAHVLDNVEKLPDFQNEPMKLAEQFGMKQNISNVNMILNTVSSLTGGDPGHIEDVLDQIGSQFQGR